LLLGEAVVVEPWLRDLLDDIVDRLGDRMLERLFATCVDATNHVGSPSLKQGGVAKRLEVRIAEHDVARLKIIVFFAEKGGFAGSLAFDRAGVVV